ncbi:MAG: alpha/beta hydrolase [Clostridia bacterium]|nr:alpha/beta hydrolase [Clostridia bacterium]
MMKLWKNMIPFGTADDFEPEITPFIVKGAKGAVVVCPGGGYGFRAPHEGLNVAKWLNTIGISAFVLDYRVAPNKHPAPLSDAMRAVKYVRHNASEFGIEKNKIAIMGFSAGGHLAASLSVHYDKKIYEPADSIDEENCRPDATILCYSVIDLGEYRHDGSRVNLLGENPSFAMKEYMSLHKQVNENTPPAFIWHTSSDSAVPVENSLLYADALSKCQIPFEMHIYPIGRHGLGLAPEEPHVAQWADSLNNWFKLIEFKD